MARRNKAAERKGREPPQPAAPLAPAERHSGEGAASVLESLRKMEDHRRHLSGPPAEPSKDDDTPRR